MVKSKATKVFIFALVVLMIFTSVPLNIFTAIETAYANNGYTGDGGGNHGASSGGQWGGNWSTTHQGVRVGIVDADGNNVLQGRTVVDIVFDKPPSEGYVMKGNKFEVPDVNGQYIGTIPIGLLNTYLNRAVENSNGLHKHHYNGGQPLPEYKDANGNIIFNPSNYLGLPMPLIYKNGVLTGNGLAVKEFFIKGALGSYSGLGGGGGGITIGSGDILLGSGTSPVGPNHSLPPVLNPDGDSESNNTNLELVKHKYYGVISRDWIRRHAERNKDKPLSYLRSYSNRHSI